MEDKITVKHKGKPCEGKDDSEEAEALVFILAYYVPTRAADTFSDLEQSCLYIYSLKCLRHSYKAVRTFNDYYNIFIIIY